VRLLLVDDDAGLRTLVRTTFEAVDVDVEEAESAQAARAAVVNRPPDAIVLDVSMPGGSGLDLCRELKADPVTSSIPIVLLTGSDAGSREDGQAAGADEFMRKPFSPRELLEQVERLVALNGRPA